MRKSVTKQCMLLVLAIIISSAFIFYCSPCNNRENRMNTHGHVDTYGRVIRYDLRGGSYHKDRSPVWQHKDYTSVNFPNNTNINWTQVALESNTFPLLTLFTTFKVTESRDEMNTNTLRLWGSLPAGIQPVLFSTPDDDPSFLEMARDFGWKTYPVPSFRKNYPIIRDMFLYAINNIQPKSFFYGFANSDIVFANNLHDTLESLSHLKFYDVKGQGFLVIGKRYDVPLRILSHNKPLKSEVLSAIVKNERLGNHYHLDYFITTAGGYPFEKIPDFVVGKPGYDNWLVSKALDWQIRTIDGTKTITAIHQIVQRPGKDLLLDTGWFSNDTCMNYEIAGIFDPNPGNVDCARFATETSRDSVIMYERKTFSNLCFREPDYTHLKSCTTIMNNKKAALRRNKSRNKE